jgi:hypothetical protein
MCSAARVLDATRGLHDDDGLLLGAGLYVGALRVETTEVQLQNKEATKVHEFVPPIGRLGKIAVWIYVN